MATLKNIKEFQKLYWLKPVDAIWDGVNAYYVNNFLAKKKGNLLDLGCGDGLNTALTFGAKIQNNYDRFAEASSKFTSIKAKTKRSDQFGDAYLKQKPTKLKTNPKFKIDFGFEKKDHHIKVAKSLGIYNKVVKGEFNDLSFFEDKSIDKIMSVFAFYWGDNLHKQLNEIKRILKKDGLFVVNLPSEHLPKIHHAFNLSQDKKISKNLKKMFYELDGNRKNFVSFHSRTLKKWKLLFKKYNLQYVSSKRIINEKMFFIQDIVQRFYMPSLIQHNKKNKKFLKLREKFIDINESYMKNLLQEELNIGSNDRFGYYCVKFKKNK